MYVGYLSPSRIQPSDSELITGDGTHAGAEICVRYSFEFSTLLIGDFL